MCGDTSIAAPVKDAKEKVAELAKVNPKTGKTGFEKQFEVAAFCYLLNMCIYQIFLLL